MRWKSKREQSPEELEPPTKMASKISFDISEAISILESQHSAREEMLRVSRKVIQQSSSSIRSTHRGELDKAQELNKQSLELLNSCREQMLKFPEISANSMFYDAQKEYAESCVTLAIISGNVIPTMKELDVQAPAYINGIVEAASELRRSILDLLRQDDLTRANELLEVMDEAYSMAVSIDFPDALTHGLRRTTDAFRAVLERTRGDITTAVIFSKAR